MGKNVKCVIFVEQEMTYVPSPEEMTVSWGSLPLLQWSLIPFKLVASWNGSCWPPGSTLMEKPAAPVPDGHSSRPCHEPSVPPLVTLMYDKRGAAKTAAKRQTRKTKVSFIFLALVWMSLLVNGHSFLYWMLSQTLSWWAYDVCDLTIEGDSDSQLYLIA